MRFWVWGFLALLASLVPFYWFQLDPANPYLAYPLYDAVGDTIFHWTLVKAIMEGHIVPFLKMVLPQMAAPYGPLVLSEGFPFPEQLQLLVIKLFGYRWDDPILVQNIYFLFGYLLTSIAFYSSAVWLRIRPALAFGLSISFTYFGYHLTRYHHLSLSQYWVLAPAAAIVLKGLDGTLPWLNPFSKWGRVWLFATAFFVTAWHSYYGYFFCGMFGAAWLIKNFRSPIRVIFTTLTPLTVGFLLALGLSTASYVVAARESTDAPTKFKRFAHETRYYRLRLHSVLLPAPHHRIPLFADLRERYIRSENAIEGTDEALGSLTVFGLFFGVFVFVRGLLRKKPSAFSHFGQAQVLTLFFASSFGISMWIATLISPTFRSVNRISPMLGAFCLFALGAGLSRFLERYDGKKWGSALTTALGILIGVFAVWDQVPQFRLDPQIYVELDAAKKFTQDVEALVGNGSVLQVPNQSFPEGGPVYQMPDYAHQVSALFSKETKWSYGAFKGTQRLNRIFSIGENPTDVFAGKKIGYAGIWIDRAGYPDRAAVIEAELRRKVRRAPIISADGRRSFFLYD